MPPVSLEVTPWTPASNPTLIARNGPDWYLITDSLRAIIEATNAGILEGATIEEKQRPRAEPQSVFAGRHPGRLARTASWVSLGTVLSDEWFIFNHRIYFNHCGYGEPLGRTTCNCGPQANHAATHNDGYSVGLPSAETPQAIAHRPPHQEFSMWRGTECSPSDRVRAFIPARHGAQVVLVFDHIEIRPAIGSTLWADRLRAVIADSLEGESPPR